MKKILIGICSTRNDDRFWKSFFKFHNEVIGSYYIGTIIVRNVSLPQAQNEIAECFLRCNYDYLLLLDDDHSGHSKDMLDCLVAANSFMATMKTYSRHYPYSCALMKNISTNKEVKKYAGIENGTGYQDCDLTGFPMTLLRRDLFKKLDAPYFRVKPNSSPDWETDQEFCERISLLGIKPVGCFQYCLDHDEVTESNVKSLRFERRQYNFPMYEVFEKRKVLIGEY